MPEILWGIDLGGTKIEAVGIKGDEVIARHRIPTEAEQGYFHIIDRIKILVQEVESLAGTRVSQLGVGTPGTFDPTSQLMRGCNTVALNGKPLPQDLSRHLEIPVKIANDANCFALAEALMGAGQNCRVVFGVIIGTGVGGGIVVDEKVIEGLQGIAGEWGHNMLETNGLRCYCGRDGCVEVCISGPALEKRYESLCGKRAKLAEIAGGGPDINQEVADLVLDYLYKSFGRAIATIVNVLDPDVIVLGGGVGNIKGLVREGGRHATPHIFNPNPKINLAAPALGDSAGVFGAALLHNALGSKGV